ncbi:EEIG1/EHBP1 protein amino-terminal domain protein [Hirschfeldia incana]|nr:EEIG1/EHBP1 protein amino-terminal domain protein [Hirschfeldia incana]
MVLGLRTKSRRDNGVFVEYLISIKELKPWPTSQVPVQCVLLKWQNGENSSGSFIAVVGKDTIMFNESFRLSLTLEPKGVEDKKFHKNLLELHVYDAKKKDKGVKNKLLGSAVVNLADYGVLTNSVPVAVGAPFTFKKSSRNDANSEVYLTIEPAGEDDGYRSSSSSQPKMRGSVDKEGSEFSLASLTDDDDDASSHCSSSRRVSFSAACDANPMQDAEVETNKDEKKGWKHVTLKHSNNEAALVSEIENLLREEERKRHSSELVVAVTAESDQKNKNDTIASKLKKQFSEIRSVPSPLPPDAARKQMRLRTNTLALGRKTLGMEGVPRLKQLKSIQVHFDGTATNTINDDNPKKVSGVSNKLGLITPQEPRTETLEDELKEAAALEAAVYSVVAEHSSSMSKVHAPARRLARFYLHACKGNGSADLSKRACAARAAVSGLILVAKACGNDIPRLTFWLSNSIVLRATLSRGIEKLNLASIKPGSDEWEDPRAFLAALEKFESWIFSRVVKSVWWQSMTPYMQSAPVKGSMTRKVSGKRRLGHKNQGLYAIELWKSAFKAACERLCPLRGSRQECGCLPMLAKLVMEQLISRLDVAMFNAILRESASEMPTDPVSDPISDINVLPIPAGKASFGAGAELKNAIGTWSRWLEDQFEQKKDKPDIDNKEKPENENFRLFHLLNSLGDLMMLPFKMLADRSTRREVCPALGPPIIQRVLRNFVPDEFNPHRIPRRLFDVLDSEGLTVENNGCIIVFPCAASPTVYLMPSTDSIKRFIGELNNPSLSETGSSVYMKQYTSDDELDDLDTSINSIISAPGTTSSSEWMPKGYGRQKTVRYQLLREIWKEDGSQ